MSGCNDDDFTPVDRLTHPGDIAFDIGANIGAYTYRLCQRVMDKGAVYAFEPVLQTFWHLRENLALNRCTAVNTFQVALGESDELCEIHSYGVGLSAWAGRGGGAMHGHQAMRAEVVQMRRLDTFCQDEKVSHIDFLKIDVEGFEASVLAGAHNLLAQGKIGHIMFEISQAPLQASGRSAREVFEILERHGYLSYRFDKPTAKFVGPVHDSTDFFANFFASRNPL